MSKQLYIFCISIAVLAGLLTSLISLYPVFQGGLGGVFFNADPDFVYLSNAISYIKTKQIFYFDHPGTPSILVLAASLIPIRLYTKLFTDIGFIFWFVQNMEVVYFYIRIIQGLILGSAVTLFMFGALQLTRSLNALLLMWMIILSHPFILYSGSGISAESTNLLLLSLLTLTLSEFIKRDEYHLLPIISMLAGLSVANRLTNISIAIAVAMLSWSSIKLTNKQKFYNFLLNSLFTCIGFVSGTWTVRNNYGSLFRWIATLANSTEIHGDGERAFFSLAPYFGSLEIIIKQQFPSVVLTTALIVALIVISAIRGIRNELKIFILTSVLIFGSLIFSKYPLSHYLLPNFTILGLLFVYIYAKYFKVSIPIISLFLVVSVSNNFTEYYRSTSKAIQQSAQLQEFITSHPNEKATLVEWMQSKYFAYIWGRNYTGGSFDQELAVVHPKLWEIHHSFDYIITRYGTQISVFDECWDHLYIQAASLGSFLNKYSNQKLNAISIPNTNLYLIESNHCTTKS